MKTAPQFIIISVLFGNLLFSATAFSRQTDRSSLIIRSVMVIDGTGSDPFGPTDVEIIAGKISRIGVNLKSAAQTVISGTGKTLTPGLIDCHTHIRSVPGAVFRGDSLDEIKSQQMTQLRAYLAAGVTTVLDAATPTSLFNEVEEISTVSPVPRFLGLSPFLTPKNGYFAGEQARREFYKDLTQPIEKESDIPARISESISHRPLGIKTTVEFGFSPFAAYPVFDAAYIERIKTEASHAGLPIFAHSEAEKAFRIALKLKPYAFMHGGFFDKPASPEIVREIKESGAYVVSTLAIYKLMLLMWDQKLFSEPWFKTLVPAEQIQTAMDSTSEVVRLLAIQNKPWFVPEFVAGLLSTFFINQDSIQKNFENSRDSLAMMHLAGVPIVMGSDSGNYPLFSTFFHGVGSILEVEALVETGLPMLEVIKASTSVAATMLKIDDEVGTIAVGKIADLILLNQDPTKNSYAFRNIDYVFKGGDARRPAEWMQSAP